MSNRVSILYTQGALLGMHCLHTQCFKMPENKGTRIANFSWERAREVGDQRSPSAAHCVEPVFYCVLQTPL